MIKKPLISFAAALVCSSAFGAHNSAADFAGFDICASYDRLGERPPYGPQLNDFCKLLRSIKKNELSPSLRYSSELSTNFGIAQQQDLFSYDLNNEYERTSTPDMVSMAMDGAFDYIDVDKREPDWRSTITKVRDDNGFVFLGKGLDKKSIKSEFASAMLDLNKQDIARLYNNVFLSNELIFMQIKMLEEKINAYLDQAVIQDNAALKERIEGDEGIKDWLAGEAESKVSVEDLNLFKSNLGVSAFLGAKDNNENVIKNNLGDNQALFYTSSELQAIVDEAINKTRETRLQKTKDSDIENIKFQKLLQKHPEHQNNPGQYSTDTNEYVLSDIEVQFQQVVDTLNTKLQNSSIWPKSTLRKEDQQAYDRHFGQLKDGVYGIFKQIASTPENKRGAAEELKSNLNLIAKQYEALKTAAEGFLHGNVAKKWRYQSVSSFTCNGMTIPINDVRLQLGDSEGTASLDAFAKNLYFTLDKSLFGRCSELSDLMRASGSSGSNQPAMSADLEEKINEFNEVATSYVKYPLNTENIFTTSLMAKQKTIDEAMKYVIGAIKGSTPTYEPKCTVEIPDSFVASSDNESNEASSSTHAVTIGYAKIKGLEANSRPTCSIQSEIGEIFNQSAWQEEYDVTQLLELKKQAKLVTDNIKPINDLQFFNVLNTRKDVLSDTAMQKASEKTKSVRYPSKDLETIIETRTNYIKNTISAKTYSALLNTHAAAFRDLAVKYDGKLDALRVWLVAAGQFGDNTDELDMRAKKTLPLWTISRLLRTNENESVHQLLLNAQDDLITYLDTYRKGQLAWDEMFTRMYAQTYYALERAVALIGDGATPGQFENEQAQLISAVKAQAAEWHKWRQEREMEHQKAIKAWKDRKQELEKILKDRGGRKNLFAIASSELVDVLPDSMREYQEGVNALSDAITLDNKLLNGGYKDILKIAHAYTGNKAKRENKDALNKKLAALEEVIDQSAAMKLGLLKEMNVQKGDLLNPTKDFVQQFSKPTQAALIDKILKQQQKDALLRAQINEEAERKKHYLRLLAQKELILKEKFDEQKARENIEKLLEQAGEQ